MNACRIPNSLALVNCKLTIGIRVILLVPIMQSLLHFRNLLICFLLQNVLSIEAAARTKDIPFSILFAPAEETETVEDLPNNAPLYPCGSGGGVEEGEYFDVVTQYMDPLCEDVRGYCRLLRNVNYTAIFRVVPKIRVETINVKITVVQQYGFETSFWPEYSACSRFNISCPMEPDVKVYAHNFDHVPNEAPPTRGIFRLRFMGTSIEDPKKKPYLCRQLNLQLY